MYLLTTCTYLWCLVERIGRYLWYLVEVDLWCLIVQNSLESQDFVENSCRGAERPEDARGRRGEGRRVARTRARPSGAILDPTHWPLFQTPPATPG